MYKTIKKLLITFILICASLSVFIYLISISVEVFPSISLNQWDFLAFVGSIIGGFITWWGVKKTISEQRKEKFLDRNRQELSEIHNLVHDIEFISKVHTFELTSEGEDGPVDTVGTLQLHADYLNDFIEIIDKRIPSLISSVEWNAIHSLDTKMKSLRGFLAYYQRLDVYIKSDGILRLMQVVDRYLFMAVEIYEDLENYRLETIKNYYNVSERKIRY